MEITINDIQSISEKVGVPFEAGIDWYKFKIEKADHGFEIRILKNGQYIFISVFHKNKEYAIEHIEFYMKESKEEVLGELFENLIKSKSNNTRVSLKNKLGTKIQTEINEGSQWVNFGYTGNEVSR